jgi:hypothetical protein
VSIFAIICLNVQAQASLALGDAGSFLLWYSISNTIGLKIDKLVHLFYNASGYWGLDQFNIIMCNNAAIQWTKTKNHKAE